MELCSLCNVNVPIDPEAKELHESGKKHVRIEAAHKELLSISERSVFLKWSSKLQITRDIIHKEFEAKFGKIQRLLFRIDSNFAIVEFSNAEFASKALSERNVSCADGSITVEKRKLDFNQAVEEKFIDVNNVIQLASESERDIAAQIDTIIKHIVISEEQMKVRLGYMEKLQNELNKFFWGATVHMFGSSITSIGTIDSDIDASLELTPSIDMPSKRDKFALMTGDALLFAANKVNYHEIMRLTSADRARFLCKILNEIRKNVSWLGHQRPVLDARCPVVRFTVNKKVIIDLSFDNKLGRAKSDYIRQLIETDKSGNLRRVLIGFRFWALSNKLFDPLPRQHKGHFNAYMLNLLIISYFMTRGVIPPFAHSENPDNTEVWRVDYTIPQFDLSGLDFAVFFKDFFVHMVALKTEHFVYSLRSSFLVPEKEFMTGLPEEAKSFKKGYLNIQDPLELSHNVCQNLCQKMVALMKRQMTYSLSILKKPGHSFCDLLDLTEIKSDSNDSTNSRLLTISFKYPKPTQISIQTVAGVVRNILDDILCFYYDPQPSTKRSKYAEETKINLGTYDIVHELWVGRRAVRKNAAEAQAAQTGKMLSGLNLEKEISRILKNTCQRISAKASISVTQDDSEMRIHFDPLDGSEFLFNTILHFLDQLLKNRADDVYRELVSCGREEMMVD